jgi:uncharacterized protein YbjQ (UPF0145 family)
MSERAKTEWQDIEVFSTPILGNLSFKPLGVVSAAMDMENSGGAGNSAAIAVERGFNKIKERLQKEAHRLGADAILDFTFIQIESPYPFNEHKNSIVAFAYGTAILKPWPLGHGRPDILKNGIGFPGSETPENFDEPTDSQEEGKSI